MNIKHFTQRLLKTVMLCGIVSMNAVATENQAAQKPVADTSKATKSVGSQPKQETVKGLKHFGGNKQQKKTASESAAVATSEKNSRHHVWIYSVDITMYDDPNHNGYFNRLVVDFDVDTAYDHERIYAVLSLTDPNGYTTDYFVTDNFNIYGESESDEYQVDTVLTSNWPADGYDLSIHIYDAYTGEVLAYVDKYDAPQLRYLTLESLDYEYADPQYMSVFKANLLLLHDGDGDGFYHDFNIELDVDVNFGARDVYAEVYISNDNYHWQHLYTSDQYHMEGTSILDSQVWNIELLSGYPKDHYFIKVLIIDAYEHNTIKEIHPQQQSAFYNIPLEDSVADTVSTPAPPPPVDNGVRTTVSSESGGSLGAGLVMLMSLLGLTRRTKPGKR